MEYSRHSSSTSPCDIDFWASSSLRWRRWKVKKTSLNYLTDLLWHIRYLEIQEWDNQTRLLSWIHIFTSCKKILTWMSKTLPQLWQQLFSISLKLIYMNIWNLYTASTKQFASGKMITVNGYFKVITETGLGDLTAMIYTGLVSCKHVQPKNAQISMCSLIKAFTIQMRLVWTKDFHYREMFDWFSTKQKHRLFYNLSDHRTWETWFFVVWHIDSRMYRLIIISCSTALSQNI